MKFRNLIYLILAGTSLVGCVTAQFRGNLAVPVKGELSPESFAAVDRPVIGDAQPTERGLTLRGFEDIRLSSKYFSMFNFIFENHSDKFLKIKKVDVDFGNEKANKGIGFPVGEDITAWAEGQHMVNALQDYNIRRERAGLVLGTKGFNPMGNHKIVATEKDLRAKSDQKDEWVPVDHLFAGNIEVAPSLPRQKWLLIYSPDPNSIPYITKVALTFTYDDGKRETVLLRFREDQDNSSQWQSENQNRPKVIPIKDNWTPL